MMKKITQYLKLLKPLLVYFILNLVAIIICVIALYLYKLILLMYSGLSKNEVNTNSISISNMFDNYKEYPELLSYALCLLFFYLWYKKLNINDEQIKYKSLLTWIRILYFMSWAIAIRLTQIGLINLAYADMGSAIIAHNNAIQQALNGNLIIVYLKVILIVPITEELLFRGIIMKKAQKIMPFFMANIVQTLMFGFVHMNLIQISYTVLSGLILGYITYKYKSLIPAVIIHSIMNLIGSLMDLVDIEISNSVFVAFIIVGSLLIFVLFYKMKLTELKSQKILF